MGIAYVAVYAAMALPIQINKKHINPKPQGRQNNHSQNNSCNYPGIPGRYFFLGLRRQLGQVLLEGVKSWHLHDAENISLSHNPFPIPELQGSHNLRVGLR